jgi:hypothetical protein
MQAYNTQHMNISTGGIQKPKTTQHELTPEEKKTVEELKKRDAEVKRHEQAHQAAAGKYARGAPKYEYETGPDGKQYAVDGEVEIDVSEIPGDPKATILKAIQIKRAALAPKDPSPQDRQVAAEAGQMEAKARRELAKQKQEESKIYNQSGQKSVGFDMQPIFNFAV